jgi:hypothetical protein
MVDILCPVHYHTIMQPKIIKFYRQSKYGVTREYIHPDNKNERSIINCLTGKASINSDIRFWVENLADKQVQFQEVIAP